MVQIPWITGQQHLCFTIHLRAIGHDLSLALNKGMTYENNVFPRNDISVVKCGLHIPEDVQNYTDFVERIKENEKTFRQKVFQNEVQ